ncbi:MAG TPA: DUF4175 family protein [Puia sp.]|nr:DUF4175 family protein [Puia sp.]
MAEGKDILRSVQRRWSVQGFLFCGLLAIAISLLLTAVLHRWGYDSLWHGIVLFVFLCCIALLIFPSWRVTVTDAARILDRHVPELEESCGLLLKPMEELGALEKLQAGRIGQRLREARLPHPLRKRLVIGVCLVAAVLLMRAGFNYDGSGSLSMNKRIGLSRAVKPVVAGIGKVEVRITPPAYTGRTVRSQQDPNLQVEEGALVSWEIQTNVRAGTAAILFNDSSPLKLKTVDGITWSVSRTADQSGFYQLKTDRTLSDLYKMEVIKDEAPSISISAPKAYTVVDIGESRRLPLIVKVRDDYGVSDVTVVATVATGSGEAVKFKEQVLSFGKIFIAGRTVYDLRQTLDLDALGLYPGDELYYYCRAKDNHGQESRSDMYIISLPDTAKLMSLEGLSTGLDVKPGLFRSQRQIIIETEQLLREKDTIPAQIFNNKSNDLAIDQKLLRLRYGKFLGEEAEEGGVNESFSAAGAGPEDFGNAAKVRDAFTDKHDNAEDATFFEPAIKQQLKATLTEMWNAELRLRTFKPQEALPYEYKALRLLKDLQQKSRAYVAKTGVRVTPPDPNKRLTGKLDEVLMPRWHSVYDKNVTDEDKLRMALSVLDRGGMINKTESEVLIEASRLLGKQAMARPGEYLAGFQAIKRVVAGAGNGGGGMREENGKAPGEGERLTDSQLAQEAIRKMVSVPSANPVLEKEASDAGLSRLYFSNVNKQ